MSDIETRVDQAFSEAVSQQLNEQREIRRLVSRVDESLVALSDGLVDLASQLGGAADTMSADRVSPEDLERARQDLNQAIERVDSHVGQIAERVGDVEVIHDIRGLVSSTRVDLVEAMARLERGAAPVAQAVDETRKEVLRALQRLEEVVDSSRDAGWQEAIGRLDQVVDSFQQRQQDHEAVSGESLSQLSAQAAEAIEGLRQAGEREFSGLQQTTAHSLTAVIGQHLAQSFAATREETVALLQTDIDQLTVDASQRAGAEMASQAAAIAEQVAREATQAVVASVEQSAARSGESLSVLGAQRMEQIAVAAATDAASQVIALTQERLLSATESLDSSTQSMDQTAQSLEHLAARGEIALVAVEEAAVRAAAHAIAALTTQLNDAAGRAASDARTVTAAKLDALLQASTEAAQAQMEQLAQAAATRLAELTAQSTARSDELAQMLGRVQALAGELEPQLRVAVDDLSTNLQNLLEEHRQQTLAAVEEAGAQRGASVGDVRLIIDQAVQRLDRQGSERFADLTEAQAEGIGRLTEVTDNLSRLPADIQPPVLAAVEQMQQGVARAMDELRDASVAAAERLEPSIRGSLQDLQQALLQASAEDRDLTQQALSSLTETATQLSAAVEQAAAHSTSVATEVTDHARELLAQAIGQMTQDLSRQVDNSAASIAESTAIVQELRTSLLASGIGELTQEFGATRAAASQAVAELGTAAEQVSGSVSSSLDRTAVTMQDAMDVISRQLQQLLNQTAGEVQTMVSQVSQDLQTQLDTTVADKLAQVQQVEQAATARMDALVTESVDRAMQRVSLAAEQRVEQVIERLGDALQRMDLANADQVARADQTQAVLSELRSKMRSDAGAVAESMELTLLQHVRDLQDDSRQTDTVLAELSDKLTILLGRQEPRRHRWAAPRQPDHQGTVPSAAPPPPPMPPPASGAADRDQVVSPRTLGNICLDCGFVAKTPPGLAAHRRICTARQS
ncbi:MAG: hypothetical protein ACR2HR_00705 [Euzebya sp.]